MALSDMRKKSDDSGTNSMPLFQSQDFSSILHRKEFYLIHDMLCILFPLCYIDFPLYVVMVFIYIYIYIYIYMKIQLPIFFLTPFHF